MKKQELQNILNNFHQKVRSIVKRKQAIYAQAEERKTQQDIEAVQAHIHDIEE